MSGIAGWGVEWGFIKVLRNRESKRPSGSCAHVSVLYSKCMRKFVVYFLIDYPGIGLYKREQWAEMPVGMITLSWRECRKLASRRLFVGHMNVAGIVAES